MDRNLNLKDEIDITGINDAELLCALYDGTRYLGLGIFHNKEEGLTLEMARDVLKKAMMTEMLNVTRKHFDYVYGRPLKVSIRYEKNGSKFLERIYLYDRDAGTGKCQQVVDSLRGNKCQM